MDERTAEQLAVLVGGEAWQSGGGIWLVTVNRDDGSLVVFSADSICEYENDEAFDAGRASKTILLTIPETDNLYAIVDLKGNVFYQDNAMERGWRYEEDHAFRVSRHHRVSDLLQERERLRERQYAIAENLVERRSCHVLHDHARFAGCCLHEVVDRRGADMIERREYLRLVTKPLRLVQVSHQVALEHLDRDSPLQ